MLSNNMLTNVGLWIILVLLIAIVPVGCIMTRPRKKPDQLPPLHWGGLREVAGFVCEVVNLVVAASAAFAAWGGDCRELACWTANVCRGQRTAARREKIADLDI
jgi:hypothetical protein